MLPHQDRAAQEVAVRADPVDPEAVKAEHPIRLINGHRKQRSSSRKAPNFAQVSQGSGDIGVPLCSKADPFGSPHCFMLQQKRSAAFEESAQTALLGSLSAFESGVELLC